MLIPPLIAIVLIANAMLTGRFGPWRCAGFPLQLEHQPPIVFSIDGQLFATSASGLSASRLTVEDRDGVGNWSGTWAPTGDSIAYVGGWRESVRILHLPSRVSTTLELPRDTRDLYAAPAWSPRGAEIAYNGDRQVHVVDIATGIDRSIPVPDGYEGSAGATWARGGSTLVFQAYRKGWSYYGDPISVFQVDWPNSVTPVPIDLPGGADDRIFWVRSSPDGQSLAYTRFDGSNYYVAGYDIAARHEFRIGPDLSNKPTWSPDGRYVAYIVLPSVFSESAVIEISTVDGQCKLRTSLVGVDRPRWYG